MRAFAGAPERPHVTAADMSNEPQPDAEPRDAALPVASGVPVDVGSTATLSGEEVQITFPCHRCKSTLAAARSSTGHSVSCQNCGETVFVPIIAVAVGTEIGGFRIVERIASGGMGDIFLADQLSMGRHVALKILSPRLTANKQLLEFFLSEVRNLARLQHPHIVTAFDAGEFSGFYYLAMAYVDGEDLATQLKHRYMMPEKQVLEIALRVGEALSYAWDEYKLLHRDIKPANIAIDKKGNIVLLDFGIATTMLEAHALTETPGAIAGTPLFMSPEVLRKEKEIDFRADLYSLGATMYNLVAGAPPFLGKSVAEVTEKHLNAPVPDPQKRKKNVSPGFAYLLQVMMAKNRKDRHASWQELIDDLYLVSLGQMPGRAASRSGAAGKEPPRAAATRHRLRRGRLLRVVLALAVTGLLAFGAAYYFLFMRR